MLLKLLLLISLQLISAALFAQKSLEQYRQEIYNAYIDNKLNQWERIINELEREYKTNHDSRFLKEKTFLQYGLTGYYLQVNDKQRASALLEKFYSGLEELGKLSSSRAEYFALMSAYYGFRLTLAPATTVYYGPKSIAFLDKAMEVNPNHPLVQNERGNADANMPAVFGGSTVKAISSYIKAMKLYEDRGEAQRNWQYLNTMLTLAHCYEQVGRKDQAMIIFNKILRIEPDFTVVKNKITVK